MSSEDRAGGHRRGAAVWSKPRWRGWRTAAVEPAQDNQSFEDYAGGRLGSFLCAQLTTALAGYLVLVLGDASLGHAAPGGEPTLAGALAVIPMAAALAVAWSRRREGRASLAALVFIAGLEAGLTSHALAHSQPLLVLPAFVLIPLTFSPVLLRGWDFAAAAALAIGGPLALIALTAPSAAERFGLLLSMGIATATSIVTNLFTLRSQRKSFRLVQQLRSFAHIDELTQLPRRRRVFELGRRVVQRTEHQGQPLSVLYIDVDHFKSVNDRFGHDAGDRVLRLLADEIQESLRPGDVCGRFGGEEFVALLPGADRHDAGRVAERLRKRIEDQRRIEVMLTISVGVAQHVYGEQIDRVIQRADAALLEAKGSGRNRVVVAPWPGVADVPPSHEITPPSEPNDAPVAQRGGPEPFQHESVTD